MLLTVPPIEAVCALIVKSLKDSDKILISQTYDHASRFPQLNFLRIEDGQCNKSV